MKLLQLAGRGTGPMPAPPDDMSLRPAGEEDYAFALALYVEGSRPLLEKIGRWNEARILRRFRAAYALGDARVIVVGGQDVGWIQIVDFKRQLYLRQIHLVASARNQGLGAKLIGELQARGARLKLPVTLDVMHGNRARGLYERLGFRAVRANLDKTRMMWRAGAGRQRPEV